MNKLMNIRSFLILITAMVAGMVAGCSEKSPGGNGPEVDGNLVINIERSTSAAMSQVDLYVLTISGPDMDTVVATAGSTPDGFVVFDLNIPVGERRLFVLEAIRNPGITFYRGQTVAPVRPGAITTLDLILRPVVPMIRLSPIMVTVAPGQPLELQVEVYNIPNLSAINIDFQWPEELFGYDATFELSDQQSPDLYFLGGGGDFYGSMSIADTAGGRIVNELGNGVLANITLQPLSHAGPEGGTILGRFEVSSVPSYIVLGSTPFSETIFFEDSEIRLPFIADRLVQFPDSTLDRRIRNDYLDSLPPESPIMLSDILPFTYFTIIDLNVADLSGIENMINLTSLNVSFNAFQDFTPLAPLTLLTSLYAENVAATSVAPLAGMTDMTYLSLSANRITDISALSEMTRLNTLELNVNQIEDISPLADLEDLSWLYLGDNQISDITVLSGLSNLYRIGLSNNQISELLPLVNNAGINSGDVVELWGNDALPDDTTQQGYVTTLRERGVTVYMFQPGQ